jgi:FtsP/CotA-like multicopper oxidase with cupredoxin domain
MSTRARLGFLAAAIVVLVVAFIALRPATDDPETTADAPTATPTVTASAGAGDTATPTPSPSPTPRPTVDPGPILTGEEVEDIRVDKGDTVRFRVRAPENEEVHVHGYDISRDVAGGKTERIFFKATIDGIFEIEFEHAGKQIASLRVDP